MKLTRTISPIVILLSVFGWSNFTQRQLMLKQACLGEVGKIIQDSLSSPLLKLPMEYRVYTPPCYEETQERRYPVLYLIHGQNYNDDQWDRLGADETADRLIADGEIPPFIIVMPRDRNWNQPTDDPFGDVVLNELVPWIDSHYRTLNNSKYRAVGGLSRGAGWAIHLGLFNPDKFGAIGGHSPPVFWSDTSKIRTLLQNIPAASIPRIYLDIGNKDRPAILASATWFENLLTLLGIPHEWHLYTGYHEEAYWQKNLPRYLQWYSSDWWGTN